MSPSVCVCGLCASRVIQHAFFQYLRKQMIILLFHIFYFDFSHSVCVCVSSVIHPCQRQLMTVYHQLTYFCDDNILCFQQTGFSSMDIRLNWISLLRVIYTIWSLVRIPHCRFHTMQFNLIADGDQCINNKHNNAKLLYLLMMRSMRATLNDMNK